MYQILIVEDEPLELQALVKLVSSFEMHFDRILQAKDSTEALELARKYNPEIIIMDISIPGISGLDVISQLRAEGNKSVFIIVSAYNYFRYAQSALRNNVMDYMLKPVDHEELTNCLKRTFLKLEQTKEASSSIIELQQRIQTLSGYIQPIIMEELLSGSPSSESTLCTLYSWPENGHLQAFSLQYIFQNNLGIDEQKQLYYEFSSLCQPYFSVIADISNHSSTYALQTLQPADPTRSELILWCVVNHYNQQLTNRALSFQLETSPMYYHYQQFSHFPLEKQRAYPQNSALHLYALESIIRNFSSTQYSKAIMRIKSGNLEKAITQYKTEMNERSTKWAGIFSFFSCLYECDPSIDLLDALQLILSSSNNPFRIISNWTTDHFHYTYQPENKNATSFTIETAIQIIEEQYSNPSLSQSDVAEHLGLSQAYFSRLFKKEKNVTFITYLTSVRIEHAKEMLKQDYSYADIAAACGYQSKKYFLDAFRQYVGKSVTQYLMKEEKACDDGSPQT